MAFNISYVAIVVRARLADMNPRYEEAARDLGANEWRTFWRITFPLILPGILSGALLAFTLSLDDFVITFFNSGPGTTTLPVFVYGLAQADRHAGDQRDFDADPDRFDGADRHLDCDAGTQRERRRRKF